jgi:hypothetical protein
MAVATYPIWATGIGFLVAIPLVAIGAVAGVSAGALGAQSTAEWDASVADFERSVTDLSQGLHEALRDRVVAIGRVRAARPVSALTESGPTSPADGVAYRSLAPAGIATVLELRIEGFGLTGDTGLRPPLWCFLTVRTRLVRTSDGKQIYEGTTIYTGLPRPVDEWLADAGAPFRDEIGFAVDWLADQIFLRVDPVDSTREVRVKPATHSDVERYLVGDQGVVGGLQRFDATFEGLMLAEADKHALWALVRETLRAAAWGSELTVRGAVDGVPFTIELERDRKGRRSLRMDGLVFVAAGEASDLARSFVSVTTPLELSIDGYAAGRRIRVTHGPGGVAVTDRGPGAPTRPVQEAASNKALEVRVRPATLEHGSRLFGPTGPGSRGQRFDAKLEDMALARLIHER